MASEGNRGMGGQGFSGSRLQNPTRPGLGSEGSSASGAAGALKEKAQDLASSVASSAEEAWDSTRQGVQQAYHAVAGTAEDAWESIAGFMRRYPLATFCMGLGAGVLLSRAFDWSPSLSGSRRRLEHPGHWDDGTRYGSGYER